MNMRPQYEWGHSKLFLAMVERAGCSQIQLRNHRDWRPFEIARAIRLLASRIRVAPEPMPSKRERRNRYRLPKEERIVQSPYLPRTNSHPYRTYEYLLTQPEKAVHLTLPGYQLDERILQLRNLRYLDLGIAGLKILPDVIGELGELRGLTLDGGTWYVLRYSLEIPPFIAQLQKLEYLDLRGKHIGQLPNEIGQLHNLRRLSLSYTRVETLPDSIGDLRQLRYIEIHDSKFKRLPETIGNLENLEILDVSNRELVALPDSIGDLHRLEKLHLDHVAMNELPDSVCDLTSLRELDISYSQIRSLPVSIGRLQNLETLNAYNSSQHLLELSPEVIRELVRLPKLKKLVLPKENRANLPDSLQIKVADW
jgi:Leucine-rich repeat (LRR) protein